MVFLDLIADDTACFATGLELDRYIYVVCRNRDNYKLDDYVAASNKKNDEKTEDMERFPDNLYVFYSIHN